ncbi:helix-turn-helix domain-containing protein [Spongisporangium articulatum]|uniref:Helix-turn-helix domain-containing protein n=1 Tax=Spongisporangium articulatum TaxID=3362603 RepID=A0ABW8AJE5_9ACTN
MTGDLGPVVRTQPPTEAIAGAVRRLLDQLEPLCAEVFASTILSRPELSVLPAQMLDDIRGSQRRFVTTGLHCVLTGQPFDDLYEAVARTARRRQAQGAPLSYTLRISDDVMRRVMDHVIDELGDHATVEDRAHITSRSLEFLRLLTIASATGLEGSDARRERRARLFELLTDDAPPGPEVTNLASQLGLSLPVRAVVATRDAQAAERLDRMSGAVTAERHGCTVALFGVDPPGLEGPHGLHGLGDPDRPGQYVETVCAAATLAEHLGSGTVTVDEVALLAPVLVLDDGAAAGAVRASFGDLPGTPRGEELLQTVSAALTLGSNAQAARELGVHRHTFEYRLRRFTELTGQDLTDPVVALRCRLGLLRLRMWPYRR